MRWLDRLLQRLSVEPGVLVTVAATQGSVPRDAGTWMAVFAGELLGTIGGGRLERDATQIARQMLPGADAGAPETCAPVERSFSLGPSLGQCCGGKVQLRFESIWPQDGAALALRLAPINTPVTVFGAGHVGQALVRVLALLPMAVHWVDSRDDVFPPTLADTVKTEHSDPVEAAVAFLAPDTRVFIMSFSHAEDFAVVAACLQRQRERGDLPYIGLIGSKTKWASFGQRLQARGFTPHELSHVTCPIGLAHIDDKRPEVIAVAAAAQLLQVGMPRSKSPPLPPPGVHC